ncbi:IclR family transcriptional regulator [Bradyrhizobium sp. dw_411]|uniref:IclR family transcriptional regulator n=1 Tax=Bradyrhizobium sp. dw_411 TaxID=2720082 RepID=UPI001BCC0400|nr:IclR family transcriptional regulator [Bradyrhizobium sp. dw_411]
MDRNPITKVLRALSRLIQEPSGLIGVREMAAGMGVSPSSAHRLLTALADEGFVRQDAASSKYLLGVEFYRLANIAAAKAPIRQAALKHMQRLVDACNETALLGIYDDLKQEMIFAARVESKHSLRYAVDLNQWIPVYAGASGLAIMAFLSDSEIESIIARTRLMPLTDLSITEPYRLQMELQKIRARGAAVSRGHRVQGAVGLAAPIFGPSGKVVGDVCLTIPEQRFDAMAEDHILDLLRACALSITEEIGGRITDKQAA